MISVAEAQARVVAGIERLPSEWVMLTEAAGRVLAEDLVARRSQPPMAVSAMDGYAVRSVDVARVPVTLRRIGAVPAGQQFEGRLGAGECVRIFTGAPLPAGADAVVIQEDTEAENERVIVKEAVVAGRHVRQAGIDFREGDVGLAAGRRLTARDVALAAAMGRPWLPVVRRPRVAILATGDEIELPGDPLGPNQIVGSTGPGLTALVRAAGGEAVHVGVARDSVASLREAARAAAGADVFVTLGGASVGEHDLVQKALAEHGLVVDFWKIAVRPGKPLMFGRLHGSRVLGLPGNPVSAFVCALLFLGPMLQAMLGLPAGPPARLRARLATPLGANDRREDYMRATLAREGDGTLWARPFPVQDSSMLSVLAASDALIVRRPNDPAAAPGQEVEVIPLDRDGAAA